MRDTRGSRKLTYILLIILLVILGALVARRLADSHLRAISVLHRLANPQAHDFLASFAADPFTEQNGQALTSQGTLRFRLYIPRTKARSGGIVLLHGVHHLGIDDPRLISFSRALAAAGVEVMTPELQDLADYRVTPRTVDTIGASVVILSTAMRQKVGVIGLSFAGGLALMAAAKPDYRDSIGYVLAVGAHDDLNRVARFFATNMVLNPDGTETPFQAHEYGMLVLAYAHLEDFFSAPDVPIAREALRQWLWEQPDAMKIAEALSPQGKQEMDLLLHHHELLRQAFLDEIQLHHAEMDAVSPHGKLGDLTTDVYLLHGSADNIIPPAETLWLERDVPKPSLKRALISKALTHVNEGKSESRYDKWQLIDFFAQVLTETRELGSGRAWRRPAQSPKNRSNSAARLSSDARQLIISQAASW